MKIKYRIHLAKINKLATATIMILTLFSCVNKELKNDWTEDGLKGKVKTVIEITKDSFCINSQGNYIGNQVEIQGAKIIYDESGNILEKNGYNSEGNLDYKLVFNYDENGNKIEAICYNSFGHSFGKTTYKYDKHGNMIKKNNYNSEGSLDDKSIYKYDMHGNMIEKNDYNSNGSLDNKVTYKYDWKGNIIKGKLYDSNGLVSKFGYKYYKNGNMKELILYDLNDKIQYRIKYDENGNEIEKFYFSNRLPDETYKYEYDEQKNWTKRRDLSQPLHKKVTEREYQYYK